jgi:glyoxylase-like metal-dependent hydrolase (beta-lactamase superfamily II)
MLKEIVEVIQMGDANGNGMLLKLELPSGIEIFGLPTENSYGGDWDLGPTWNYLVMLDKPFLVDTGRLGMGATLLKMMKAAGIEAKDLDSILISHGHEDHDGGLAEMTAQTGAEVKAHSVYDRLIRYYPDDAPPDFRKGFPAFCWRCFMPESYIAENCLEYHRTRSRVPIRAVHEGNGELGDAVDIRHVPGHSPDALALILGGEAILIGDTVLPGITPWPSQEAFFHPVREILSPDYTHAEEIFGLRAYIRSLKKLKKIGTDSGELLVLPAHRLFYGSQWNEIDLGKRVDELVEHHIQRCGAVLDIVRRGQKTAAEIAREHFEERQLKGYGILMAENEIVSHCELLEACGDVRRAGDHYQATGTMNFESFIPSLERESGIPSE